MASEVKCSNCLATGIDENGYCMVCGEIVDEHQLISSVQFDAASSMIGHRLSATQTTVWSAGHNASKTDSMQDTINKGKREISKIASALNIAQYVDKAHRLFMVAASDKFTQGRRREIVCACCLYICCRLEHTPLMLIDFADALQTNMFTLGNCFMRLKDAVAFPGQQRKSLMAQDPSVFIHRFAGQLEFGKETHRVAITAMRLVGRMRRDWMTAGRRPSGICAAALLIASRMHGFQRSQRDIVQVVKICEETLRHRLLEFDGTPAAKMTPDEFEELAQETHSFEVDPDGTVSIDDGIAIANPPAFQYAEIKRQEDQKRREAEESHRRSSSGNASQGNKDSQGASAPKSGSGIAQVTAVPIASNPKLAPRQYRHSADARAVSQRESGLLDLEKLYAELRAELDANDKTSTTSANDETAAEAARAAREILDIQQHKDGAAKSLGSAKQKAAKSKQPSAPSTIPLETALAPSNNNGTMPDTNKGTAPDRNKGEAPDSDKGQASDDASKTAQPDKPDDVTSGSDLSEPEDADELLSSSLLAETESRKKRTIWESVNSDWEKKRDERIQAEKDGLVKTRRKRSRKKKNRTAYGRPQEVAETAIEATQKAAAALKISKKVNYDALKQLLGDEGDTDGAADEGNDADADW